MIERIVIEIETPGDSRTMFRVEMDRLVIGGTRPRRMLISSLEKCWTNYAGPAGENSFRAPVDRPMRGRLRSPAPGPRARNELHWQRILAL